MEAGTRGPTAPAARRADTMQTRAAASMLERALRELLGLLRALAMLDFASRYFPCLDPKRAPVATERD